jgi:hypothetical protein
MTALSILDLVRVTEDTDARGALDDARDIAIPHQLCKRLGARDGGAAERDVDFGAGRQA